MHKFFDDDLASRRSTLLQDKMFRPLRLALLGFAFFLNACATSEKMTVTGTPDAAPPKYRNAFAVRNITGGCNIVQGGIKAPICVEPPVPLANVKEGLEKSLAANGYLATSISAPKYYIDADIEEIRAPMLALDLEITTTVNYKVTGEGTVKNYPIKAAGTATLVEMPIGAARAQYAILYSLRQNFTQFLQALRQ